MELRVAWVLNLDAEEELAAKGRGFTRSRAMSERIAALVPRLSSLVLPGDVILGTEGRGLAGRAWCPTPSAIDQIRSSGAIVPRAPEAEVLRRVNHRRFSAELGQTLPGAEYVSEERALDRVIAALPDDRWLLKRPFGFAGRARRAVKAREMSEADRSWIRAALSKGEGLQVEPIVLRELDAAIHGYLDPSGELIIGTPVVQRVDEHGAWIETIRSPLISADEQAALESEAKKVARALHDAGYFGPFGIDAFRFRDRSGAVRFQPRSEINARYTMGFGIGMGAFRAPAGLP
jgi:phosphoribosylaminoimidazole carboxylase (NCAIR synthetase)